MQSPRTSGRLGPAAVLAVLAILSDRAPSQTLTFPATLSSSHVSLTFDLVGTTELRLLAITNRDGATPFTFVNDPTQLSTTGPWQIRGHGPAPAGAPFAVDSSAAATFAATSSQAGNETVFHFVWTGVRIDSANFVRVELDVALGATDPVSRWSGRVTREAGNTASIEEVDFPVLCVKGPVAPRSPQESHANAQWRTRLLIPTALLDPLPAANLPVAYHAVIGRDYTLKHPHAEQVMQFSVLHDADTADAGFNRMLYVGTRDATGHYKTFRHHPFNTAGGQLYYHWTTTYFPTFADLSGQPSRYGNEFMSPYPALVGSLTARSDDFWYDAAAYYRSILEDPQTGFAPPRLELNTLLGDSVGPTISSFPVMVAVRSPAGPGTLYERFLELTRTWRAMLQNPYASTSATYLHFQNYLNGGIFGVADHPLSGSVDPDVLPVIDAARTENIRCSVYTFPVSVPQTSGWASLLPTNYIAWDIDGLPQGDPNVFVIDYAIPGANAARDWYGNTVLLQMIQHLDLNGFYLDIMSGTGTRLTYDPSGLPPYHPAHGGDGYEQGQIAMIDHARDVLNQNASAMPGPHHDVYLMSEAPEEYLAGHLDFIGRGYDFVPRHLQLLEEYLQSIGLPGDHTGVAAGARDWNPPMWNAVYHEYAPSSAMVTVPTTLALAMHPLNGNSGLTGDQLREYLAYVFGAYFLSGTKPSAFPYYVDIDYPLVVLGPSGNVTHDPVNDVQQVGPSAVTAIRDLYAAQEREHGGQYMLFGRMMRPLPVDLATASRRINPTNACYSVPIAFRDAVLPFNEPARGQTLIAAFPYDVTSVQHSVWRSPEGKIGILLYNWTLNPASFRAVFDPTNYDLGPTQTYHVSQSVQGAQDVLLGSYQGNLTLDLGVGGGGGGNVLSLGSIPARTLYVLELEPW
ncbi:MAG: hypothetical protein IPM29_15830 [Planctomycetes bacterium]|nr:hypothetical protein [Planctomycetota bacterium]